MNFWLLLAIGLAVMGAFGGAGDTLTNRNQQRRGTGWTTSLSRLCGLAGSTGKIWPGGSLLKS
jgi:hypothetical protein